MDNIVTRWIERWWEKEWPVVSAAPFSLGFAAIVLAGIAAFLTFLVVEWHFAEQVGTLKDRIETVEASDKWHSDQLAEWQRVFPGRSTDEAVKEIDSLKKDMATAQQAIAKFTEKHARHLKPPESAKLTDALMSLPRRSKQLWVYAVEDSHAEAYTYGKQFATLLKDIGFSVNGPILVPAAGEEPLSEIMVGVLDVDHPSEDAKTFKNALMNAGFQVSYTRWYWVPDPKLYDFDLFIGPVD